MYKNEIITLIKAIKQKSGKQSRDIAAELGITPNRMSILTNQGDMKLSTFIRLLEVTGQSMEITPTVGGEVIKVSNKNQCNECEYKHIAEQMDDSAVVKMDEKTNKLVIEV